MALRPWQLVSGVRPDSSAALEKSQIPDTVRSTSSKNAAVAKRGKSNTGRENDFRQHVELGE